MKSLRILLNLPSSPFAEAMRAELVTARPSDEIIERVGPFKPEELDGAGVSILVSEQAPKNVEKWPDLKWIQLLAAGTNTLDGHPAWRLGIPITTASGLHGIITAQFTTCAWLMHVHKMPRLAEFQTTRKWPDRRALAGHHVRGLTAGIVGYGSIGRECARQLNALGMRVAALKRDPSTRRDNGYNAWPETGDPEGKLPELWFSPAQTGEMLALCDLVVITAPRTRETTGMIGAAELDRIKKGACVVIVSRGGIVDERALAQALGAGRVGSAVVDCFVEEPPPADHPLFDAPNVILTPHMSGVSNDFWKAMGGLILENLRRLDAGEPLLNRADPVLGY